MIKGDAVLAKGPVRGRSGVGLAPITLTFCHPHLTPVSTY